MTELAIGDMPTWLQNLGNYIGFTVTVATVSLAFIGMLKFLCADLNTDLEVDDLPDEEVPASPIEEETTTSDRQLYLE